MNRGKIPAAVAAAIVAAGLLPAAPAGAVSGAPGDDYAYVGAIGVTLPEDNPLTGSFQRRFVCSGALLSPDQFLSAAHCASIMWSIAEASPGTQFWVSFANDLDGYLDEFAPTLGAPVNLTQVVPVDLDATALPLGERGTPLFDLAVFQLDASVDGPALPLLTEEEAGTLARLSVQEELRLVGYGSEFGWQTGPDHRGDPKVWAWDGTRRDRSPASPSRRRPTSG